MNHSPEPWKHRTSPCTDFIEDAEGNPVLGDTIESDYSLSPDNRLDIPRIVACVNAMNAIKQPELFKADVESLLRLIMSPAPMRPDADIQALANDVLKHYEMFRYEPFTRTVRSTALHLTAFGETEPPKDIP